MSSSTPVRNRDYKTWGSQYRHVVIWTEHHGIKLDGRIWIVHHKNHNKQDNTICTRPAPCPVLDCGNLAPRTRRDHILEHKPGRMGGRSIPNKAGAQRYYCARCGVEKSRHGTVCARCSYPKGGRPRSATGAATAG